MLLKYDQMIIKYVQLIALQLYLSEGIKKNLMGIASPLGPKPTIPNNGNNLYQKDLIVSTGYSQVPYDSS